MFWISYYLDKGFKLDYLLNLAFEEKVFFQESMRKMMEEKMLYDSMKMEVFFKAFGG